MDMRRVIGPGFAAAVVAGVTAGVTACSGSTASVPSISADQASSDAATALCAQFSSCSAFFIQSEFGDVTACAAAFKASLLNTLSAPGTSLTPTRLESCAQAIAGIACDDALGHNLPAACQATAGQLANGTPCGDSSQCQSAYCNKPRNMTCGACGAPPTTGATCDIDDDCPVGNVCFKGAGATAGSSGTCVVQGASGAACDDTQHPCKATLTCKNGTCAAPDTTTCTARSSGDLFGTCNTLGGEYCDPRTHTCAAVGMAATGQACLLVNGGVTLCSSNGTCSAPPGTSGTCAAAAAPGASCDATNGPKCLQPSVCQGGVCVTPSAANCH
jgi:hypothetical protein